MKMPELVRKCSACSRMRPASKLEGGRCKDETGCAAAQAELLKVLAKDKEYPLRRDHWV